MLWGLFEYVFWVLSDVCVIVYRINNDRYFGVIFDKMWYGLIILLIKFIKLNFYLVYNNFCIIVSSLSL